jgi:hypothetical protein
MRRGGFRAGDGDSSNSKDDAEETNQADSIHGGGNRYVNCGGGGGGLSLSSSVSSVSPVANVAYHIQTAAEVAAAAIAASPSTQKLLVAPALTSLVTAASPDSSSATPRPAAGGNPKSAQQRLFPPPQLPGATPLSPVRPQPPLHHQQVLVERVGTQGTAQGGARGSTRWTNSHQQLQEKQQRQLPHNKLSRAPGPLSPGQTPGGSVLFQPGVRGWSRGDETVNSTRPPPPPPPPPSPPPLPTPREESFTHSDESDITTPPPMLPPQRLTPTRTPRRLPDVDPRVVAAAKIAAEEELKRVSQVVRNAVAAVRGATTSQRPCTARSPPAFSPSSVATPRQQLHSMQYPQPQQQQQTQQQTPIILATGSGDLGRGEVDSSAGARVASTSMHLLQEGALEYVLEAEVSSAREKRMAAVGDDIRSKVARLRGEVGDKPRDGVEAKPNPTHRSAPQTTLFRTPSHSQKTSSADSSRGRGGGERHDDSGTLGGVVMIAGLATDTRATRRVDLHLPMSPAVNGPCQLAAAGTGAGIEARVGGASGGVGHAAISGFMGVAAGATSFRRAAAALAVSRALASRAGAEATAVGASAVSSPERCAALSRVGADVERRLQAAAAHR